MQRYLAARKDNVAAAVKMLRKTLEWRQSYRPQDITFQEIKALAATGRLEVLEHRDLEGRPVLCYRLRCDIHSDDSSGEGGQDAGRGAPCYSLRCADCSVSLRTGEGGGASDQEGIHAASLPHGGPSLYVVEGSGGGGGGAQGL